LEICLLRIAPSAAPLNANDPKRATTQAKMQARPAGRNEVVDLDAIGAAC